MTTRRSYDVLAWILYLLFNVVTVQPNCLPGYTSYRGYCYGGPHDALNTWHTSEQFCRSLGGHLTSVTSLEEHNFLLNLIRQYKLVNHELWNEVWIGLTHPNPVNYRSDYSTKRLGWLWSDGRPYTFQAWAPLAPANNERYGRLSHGVWLGSIDGNSINNFICKISVNVRRTTIRGLYPRRTTIPDIIRPTRPRISTTRVPPVPLAPTGWPTIFQKIPRVPPEGVATTFKVATPTTSSKNIDRDSKPNVDDTNFVNTNSNRKPKAPQKKVEELEDASSGFSTNLIPVAAIVPAIAIVMIGVLAVVLCRSSRSPKKSKMYGDLDSKSSIADTKSTITQDFRMTPLSTLKDHSSRRYGTNSSISDSRSASTDSKSGISQDFRMTPRSALKDPTSAQYYNATYRSLSSLLSNARKGPISPPVYTNEAAGMSTIKSCYENHNFAA